MGQAWGNSLNHKICSYLHLSWKRAVAMTTSGPAISDHEFQGLEDEQDKGQGETEKLQRYCTMNPITSNVCELKYT